MHRELKTERGFPGSSVAGNAVRMAVVLLGLCWAAAASAQDLQALRAPQKVAFPHGFNIVDGQEIGRAHV